MADTGDSSWEDEIREQLACRSCTAEVRLTAGARVYARVVHEASCPWLPRYLARELVVGQDYLGAVPCGIPDVTHRGPYKRRAAAP
jgi:hypothetical protein